MKKTHWFHFTLDRKTIELLIALGGLESYKKVPGFISEVLFKFSWYLERYHLTGMSRKCRYERISDDLQDERKKMWLPLPEVLYQRLKSIHKDLDFFSISQIVRIIIKEYVALRVRNSQVRVFHYLNIVQRFWAICLEAFKHTPSKHTRGNHKWDSQSTVPSSTVSSDIQWHMRLFQEFESSPFESYLIIYNENAEPIGRYCH